MAEEIDFENGRNSNFEGLVTLTLTFDPAIRHIVLQQSSTSTYIPNFIQIEETFCGRTDVRTDGRTYGRTDVRTYGRTDGRTDVRTGGRTFFPSILLGRLSEVDLKTNFRQNRSRSLPVLHCLLVFLVLSVCLSVTYSNYEVCNNGNAMKQCNFQNSYGTIA